MTVVLSRLSFAVSGLAAAAGAAMAQPVRLVTPNATLAEEFAAVRGVRELSDGRVLVSDYLDQRVVLADFARGSVTVRVSEGGGPGEARLPTRLIALPGDSTILVDLGNNRLVVLDGQGRAVRTVAAERPGMLGLRGVDAGGHYLFVVPAWAERDSPLPGDSVRVVRWDPRTDQVTVIAVIQGDRMRSDIRQPARTPRIPTVGFAAQDGWAVTDGGVIRIVRAGGYRVESHSPGAEAVAGPSYAYETRPVSAADRLAFVREFLTTSPMSGKGVGGGMGFSPTPTEPEIAGIARGTEFAERHPMFSAGDVIPAPGGRLWVGRPPEAGRPVLYDVFDQAGRRLRTVELRPGRRVMAIGRGGVYVVAESEVGLQHLERYPAPE